MEGLLTSFQQAHPRSRPACRMHAFACLLILGSVCRTFRKAHGRYCSQKLMPRRGTANSSPGRSNSFTDRGSEAHAARNTLYPNSPLDGDTISWLATTPLTATDY
jgi:hypothetical protein